VKAFIRFVLVAVLVVVFAGASAPAADEVLEATLDNGLRVLLVVSAAPSAVYTERYG